MIAALMLTGIASVAHASQTAQAMTTASAGINGQFELAANVQAQSSNGQVSGYCGASGIDFEAENGWCYGITFSSDAKGQHAAVSAAVYFTNAEFSNEPALATFVMTKHADGSCSVGVEIIDYSTGEVLETTGLDAQNNITELPVYNGGMFLKQ
jgi:hypothetical protein